MDDLTPITRLEYDLDGIVNNHSLLDPITRVEMYLSDIAAGRTASLSPITRIEMYLAKISGASVEVPAPITRVEMYLAAIAGEDVETPDPITRVEYWLDQWADQSGSGVITTVTGTSPLALANALDKSIRKLIQYGKVTTSNGDTYCNNGKLVAVGDELSVVGTPEVLTVGEQTATVENLLAVDDIKDEQNIISGTVIRRCEAVVSDGTTPSGRYIGEVGEGNIIVKVRETGYEGDVATFEADRVAPLNGLTVNVEPIQAGTGDPSPDNVRPISGRTSATVTRTGKNLFPTASVNLGNPNRRTQNIILSEPIPAGSYVFSYVRGGTYTGTAFGIEAFNGYRKVGIVNPNNGRITLSDTAQKFYIYLDTTPYDNDETITFSNCQLELGSTATDYEPYQANTYTITLGDTVYGGSLDVTQGKMVVDRLEYKLLWSSGISPTVGTTCTTKYLNVYGEDIFLKSGNTQGKTISDIIPYQYNNNDTPHFYLAGYDVNARRQSVRVFLPNDTDPDTEIQFVLGLATPLEITLTPTQIETLLGTNNIWSDAGAVKAYVADAELIEHVTAQPLRTAEGSNTVSVTSAVAPVQLSATYTASE